jgi:type IV pilus assembly protein PilV
VKKSQGGVALLEALVGILIFSVGILALMGLQAQSIRNTVEAKYRNEAAYLANRIVGQMWVDRANLAAYDTGGGASLNMVAWRNQVAATLPGIVAAGVNSPTIDVAANQVTVTVFWRMPGADSATRQLQVVAQINSTDTP